MKNKIFVILFAGFIFPAIFSCSNSYDDMIEKFDEKVAGKSFKEISITDSGFSEKNMIVPESYLLDKKSVFSIAAPAGGKTYKWQLSREGLTEPIELGTTRSLVYSMPGDFSTTVPNYLLLTVTDEAGKEYSDSAKIVLQ